MKFILKAEGQGDIDCWSGWAVVEIDQQYRKQLLSRRELFQMVRSRDKHVSTVEYNESPVYLFEDGVLDLDSFLTEVEKTQLKNKCSVRVPDARVLPGHDTDGAESVFDEWTHVEFHGVFFRSRLDSTDQDVLTRSILWEELLKL